MESLNVLKSHLKKGQVYRRQDLVKWSNSVDRHLDLLVKDGTLEKLSQGLYYYPRTSAFGVTPPEEEMVVRRFLNDDRFLLTSPNNYNRLGVGTTQLYNSRVVYNHKRHGDFKLGNKTFTFKVKHHFPDRLSEEFLLIDLVNNLNDLAEDQDEVLNKVLNKVREKNPKIMAGAVAKYANSRTKNLLAPVINTGGN